MEKELFINQTQRLDNTYDISKPIDFKYPTFDDPMMDDELKKDITYIGLMTDIHSVVNLLDYFQDFYSSLLKNNPHNILDSFRKSNLNCVCFSVFALLIKRVIVLMNYLLTIKFENKNDIDVNSDKKEAIELEYINVDKEQLINTILNNNVFIPLLGEDEIKEIREIFNEGFKKEKVILDCTVSPSICGIGVGVKYLKVALEQVIMDIQLLSDKKVEDTILDFFQNVYI